MLTIQVVPRAGKDAYKLLRDKVTHEAKTCRGQTKRRRDSNMSTVVVTLRSGVRTESWSHRFTRATRRIRSSSLKSL